MREIIMGIVGSDIIESRLLWQKALARGVEQGELDAMHRAILTVLDARALRVTPAQRERITSAIDRAKLDAWLRAAPVAKTTGEVLRQTASASRRRATARAPHARAIPMRRTHGCRYTRPPWTRDGLRGGCWRSR